MLLAASVHTKIHEQREKSKKSDWDSNASRKSFFMGKTIRVWRVYEVVGRGVSGEDLGGFDWERCWG